jgi:Cyclic nucleotide-binding domain
MTPQKNPPKVVRANGNGKPAFVTANGKTQIVDWAEFLGGISRGKTVLEYGANRTIFVQGDPADSVWYLQRGEVKLAVISQQGKEAIVSILGDNEFFGDGCLAGQPLRVSTATAVRNRHPCISIVARQRLSRGFRSRRLVLGKSNAPDCTRREVQRSVGRPIGLLRRYSHRARNAGPVPMEGVLGGMGKRMGWSPLGLGFSHSRL